MQTPALAATLNQAALLRPGKVLAAATGAERAGAPAGEPILVLLAAGKGTRFGSAPKCAQLVDGIPLARHSIAAFRALSSAPVICVVGYRHEEVMRALGEDLEYVLSDDPAGGTAFAAYEAFNVPLLANGDPLVVVSMGDRIIPSATFQRLRAAHLAGAREAELTFLTALYEPPRNRGKGRILRDADRRVRGIVEQHDIDALADGPLRRSLDALTEGNCPLYAMRARALRRRLESVSNDNAQRQYYLTDIIASAGQAGVEVRTITATPADPDYHVLCADVTRELDLAWLEGRVRAARAATPAPAPGVEAATRALQAHRPVGQLAAITRQLESLTERAAAAGFRPDRPVAAGVSGGRLRIAFMHPDMGRFFGPAWQMPIGARDADGAEQIVIMMQASDDDRIHLVPDNAEFQEKASSIAADAESMYPGPDVADWYSYEAFGTRMAERLLLGLGYFTSEELQDRGRLELPLPPSSLWVITSMRRPFSLVANALASIRTVRDGHLGAKVQAALGRGQFHGLRIVTTGNIPRGGFSSSSAVTVATTNALNALFELGLPPDLLVRLSCQAEYGTGVRAGSLDQATEQKGRAGEGTLISSNPRDNYRILATYPVPADRFKVLFPYSVDRDREAWRWSAGFYGAGPESAVPTTAEWRKLTGKAAELAALLLELPLDQDFFKRLEPDLVAHGRLGLDQRRWVGEVLRAVPLSIRRDELVQRIQEKRKWFARQLMELEKLDAATAGERTDATFASLFEGWREPALLRPVGGSSPTREPGVPLRAMVAYLFGEVAKNFELIHHPEAWIEWVSRSQRGDCCFAIEPDRIPGKEALLSRLDWERGLAGPVLLERWLERTGARPFHFNAGLEDGTLLAGDPPDPRHFQGTNFFRGLALIDLAEAMLKRAFGNEAVAVRINAAGQGDFFQVHVDQHRARVEEVKDFIRQAFYTRFGLRPPLEFVEVHPGGGAAGVRLERLDDLPELIRVLARRPLA